MAKTEKVRINGDLPKGLVFCDTCPTSRLTGTYRFWVQQTSHGEVHHYKGLATCTGCSRGFEFEAIEPKCRVLPSNHSKQE